MVNEIRKQLNNEPLETMLLQKEALSFSTSELIMSRPKKKNKKKKLKQVFVGCY